MDPKQINFKITKGQTAVIFNDDGRFSVVPIQKDDSLWYSMLVSYMLENQEIIDYVQDLIEDDLEYEEEFLKKMNPAMEINQKEPIKPPQNPGLN